jgi:hypothetical protein
VPAAEWSEEAAVENKKYILFAAKIRQAYFVSFEIRQGKVRGGLIEFDAFAHAVIVSFAMPVIFAPLVSGFVL